MERVDLSQPVWDLNTFSGRLQYYRWITNPLLSLHSEPALYSARDLIQKYRAGEEPPGTTVSQIRQAQQLYLSAFHPDTGEIQNVIGRMSFQVPGGMILIGAMITFYRSNTAVIFWQWANQSFNALVNYTNRNAASDISKKQLGFAYVTATSSALVTALGLKAFLAKRAAPVLQRFVPFAAVCAANMVNIPLMRQSELTNGVVVMDEENKPVTKSKYAAVKGISQVVFSRIVICSPSMVLLPILMEKMDKTSFMLRYGRYVNAPLQILLSGLSLVVMVPVGCALFNQQCSISVDKLKIFDSDAYEEVKSKYGKNIPKRLYFNKGL
ncbi:sideroflexin-2-like [Saccostrea echinata]|uniref:sideroflexin-2-like n=1 Tax=Saccostrea echinata TaxID=191078 RepID=UPI002A80FAC6|nr:sideroflexin-2-like [Saccostrea echinata]XP_061189019.1 sideroflexin-2-like [Saccostrea echinata]